MCMSRAVCMLSKDLRRPWSHFWLIFRPCASGKWRLRQNYKFPVYWKCTPSYRVPWQMKTYCLQAFKETCEYTLEKAMAPHSSTLAWRKDPDAGKEKAGAEGYDRGWDGWMTSPTRWTWVWASSGSWWWTGRPGCSPWGRKELDMTEGLNWTDSISSTGKTGQLYVKEWNQNIL